jgi:hypothetical protein
VEVWLDHAFGCRVSRRYMNAYVLHNARTRGDTAAAERWEARRAQVALIEGDRGVFLARLCGVL